MKQGLPNVAYGRCQRPTHCRRGSGGALAAMHLSRVLSASRSLAGAKVTARKCNRARKRDSIYQNAGWIGSTGIRTGRRAKRFVGNVNRKGDRTYHVKGWRDHAKMRLKPEEGDVCYQTVSEAELAGFRKPYYAVKNK